MTDPNENPQKKKRSSRDWETAVEKTIREAMERGDFDNLAGKGKPLDLEINPFVPGDRRQAFRILQNAGVAPDWIEQDKDIRAEKTALEMFWQKQARWFQERAARLKTLAPDRMIAEHEQLARSRDQILARYRDRAAALNKIIDTFNLKVPSGTRHHGRIQIQDEIQKFLDACKT